MKITESIVLTLLLTTLCLDLNARRENPFFLEQSIPDIKEDSEVRLLALCESKKGLQALISFYGEIRCLGLHDHYENMTLIDITNTSITLHTITDETLSFFIE